MSILWLSFLTGLTTGGISCLAVQGGLLATAVAEKQHRFSSVLVFVVSKLLAYTMLGFLLGFAGSALVLTPRALGWVQIAVGLFMTATALRMIDAHPIFRYVVIQPPRWAFRLMKHTSRSQSFFAPAILGFLTILLPCGVTQATMAVAITSGNPWMGAGIMAAFILGTSPVFFILGATVVELLQKKVFSYIAAALIGVFALLSINGGLVLTGSPYTLQNLWRVAVTPIDELTGEATSAPIVGGVQEVTIDINPRGYTASATRLKRAVPVRITLRSNGTLGCARAFTIPDYGIAKVVPVTGEEIVEFTPEKTGRLVYTCSMGMYSGVFTVEE